MQHKKQKDKRKGFVQISQNPFVYCFLLTPLPRSAKGAGDWGLRHPKGFFVLF